MRDADRWLGVLHRYHTKVNHPDYTKRKRGNPPYLIKAVAVLRGGKRCVKCGSYHNPHLHHVNGNWRDYRLENLQFYCQPCHMNEHHNKEKHMSIRSTRRTWTYEQLQELRQDVNRIVQQQRVNKTAAFKLLTGKYGLSAVTIENYYYDKAGRYTNRQAVSPTTRAFINVPNPMPIDDAYAFYEFCRKAGITVG